MTNIQLNGRTYKIIDSGKGHTVVFLALGMWNLKEIKREITRMHWLNPERVIYFKIKNNTLKRQKQKDIALLVSDVRLYLDIQWISHFSVIVAPELTSIKNRILNNFPRDFQCPPQKKFDKHAV
ncbi:hypothetical protein F9L16_17610 [Agarivorans sp. B2Z047]|uniref:hypothetical protein n=1 Tax=Agarivorans sp. B2Z047 TaxID=2652721 RepID=UPI00128D3AD0|nr:hypothetical protein [Agarivorans sp. B2Z047]MPW30806.1 hypothetical protein [Agarivorans sp. B2Z047]UQN40964.1 hypothetical protein LQZ07_14400 [Agarivorans sp. B2Z047]